MCAVVVNSFVCFEPLCCLWNHILTHVIAVALPTIFAISVSFTLSVLSYCNYVRARNYITVCNCEQNQEIYQHTDNETWKQFKILFPRTHYLGSSTEKLCARRAWEIGALHRMQAQTSTNRKLQISLASILVHIYAPKKHFHLFAVTRS